TGAPAGPGAASECGDDKGPWYDDPADVPGNDPDLLAEGVYTAVNRVRVHTVIPAPTTMSLAVTNNVYLWLSIGMRVAEAGNPYGAITPTWASDKRVNYPDASMEEVLADSGAWNRSTYDPETHTGNRGDRLKL